MDGPTSPRPFEASATAGTSLPIVPHFTARLSPSEQAQIESLAEQLVRENPKLIPDDRLRPLLVTDSESGGTLHLDDIGGITRPNWAENVHFLHDRARLRAGDGDFVASFEAPPDGYEAYCRDQLGLGAPHWLHPAPDQDRSHLAQSCWQDRNVRNALAAAARRGELRYIQPYLGNSAVWQLADLLHRKSNAPLKVVAPHPELTRWVNDKLDFSKCIVRLFGADYVPYSEEAANLVTLTRKVRELSEKYPRLSLKVPDSAGGGGNVVVEAASVRGLSLEQIRDKIKLLLEKTNWNGETKLLLGCWETNVHSAPSAQLWIPPLGTAKPVIEGLFTQAIDPDTGYFLGSQPADLPEETREEMVSLCARLARLYQQLGYIGRCSFDMLLVERQALPTRIKFIECNGRWGGTSLPMTLMNRMFGDWATRPFSTLECHAEGLEQLEFQNLLTALGSDVYDRRTGQGKFVLYNPGRMQAHSGINVLSLADSWQAAEGMLKHELPKRLASIVASRAT